MGGCEGFVWIKHDLTGLIESRTINRTPPTVWRPNLLVGRSERKALAVK
jgi:hypothetical protein